MISANNANIADLVTSWRNSIVVLSWAGCLVFAIATVLSMIAIDCMACCNFRRGPIRTPKTEKASDVNDRYKSVAEKYRKNGDVESPATQFIAK